jgi:DNA-binding winged helix-turn-helix (wHTH) protein
MQNASEERSDADAQPSGKPTSRVRFAGLVLDLDACTLARESGEAIPLTRNEFRRLRLFVNRPGRVLNRDVILNAVASRPLEPFDRSVDSMVVRLRRKIEPDLKQPRLIVTVPGEGYRFDGLERCASRLDLKAADLDPTEVKNIAEPVQVYSLEVGQPAEVSSRRPGWLPSRRAGGPRREYRGGLRVGLRSSPSPPFCFSRPRGVGASSANA